MPKINSRQKGARFERDIAKRLRDWGYDARRGQQYSGLNGDADVVGLPGVHLELKAVEHLSIYTAMAQSCRDARDGEKPVVIHKKNYEDILVTMKFDDWFEMYREWESGHGE